MLLARILPSRSPRVSAGPLTRVRSSALIGRRRVSLRDLQWEEPSPLFDLLVSAAVLVYQPWRIFPTDWLPPQFHPL